ncbi:MAG TPA: Smr/MutS family protein [Thermoanaerobaculia bacterium]|nr:Smr/MutS family protein [Thermoanaerobaculia bacterium]
MTRQIDLHGLTVAEAIRKFVASYNSFFESGYRGRIEVIHGYGSSGAGGVIRRKLRSFLAANADRFKRVVEGDSVGNPGVTIVEAKGRLPAGEAATPIEQAILTFCRTPKSENKILVKLIGRYGDPAIRAAIRQMVNNGSLERIRGGAESKYRAVS